MEREEAMRIIIEEKLKNYNFNEERAAKENEVVIKCENDAWIVYATDERASTVTGSKRTFHAEYEALENLIKRLRADKILSEL